MIRMTKDIRSFEIVDRLTKDDVEALLASVPAGHKVEYVVVTIPVAQDMTLLIRCTDPAAFNQRMKDLGEGKNVDFDMPQFPGIKFRTGPAFTGNRVVSEPVPQPPTKRVWVKRALVETQNFLLEVPSSWDVGTITEQFFEQEVALNDPQGSKTTGSGDLEIASAVGSSVGLDPIVLKEIP